MLLQEAHVAGLDEDVVDETSYDDADHDGDEGQAADPKAPAALLYERDGIRFEVEVCSSG